VPNTEFYSDQHFVLLLLPAFLVGTRNFADRTLTYEFSIELPRSKYACLLRFSSALQEADIPNNIVMQQLSFPLLFYHQNPRMSFRYHRRAIENETFVNPLKRTISNLEITMLDTGSHT
jgi:hypothetical protein